eukprot:TRINITY_DN6255_c0_g1_i1.p1 TRINITY_DN6255_c0_g1~~TRINITY_DN6255_c0_g1_i1.p1  ORF type:complete len:873 (-),score=173.75 TRINITY_DN6255_c0_g1_i1:262-2880(-)
METCAHHAIPVEVWSSVAEQLSLVDLVRCAKVCVLWREMYRHFIAQLFLCEPSPCNVCAHVPMASATVCCCSAQREGRDGEDEEACEGHERGEQKAGDAVPERGLLFGSCVREDCPPDGSALRPHAHVWTQGTHRGGAVASERVTCVRSLLSFLARENTSLGIGGEHAVVAVPANETERLPQEGAQSSMAASTVASGVFPVGTHEQKCTSRTQTFACGMDAQGDEEVEPWAEHCGADSFGAPTRSQQLLHMRRVARRGSEPPWRYVSGRLEGQPLTAQHFTSLSLLYLFNADPICLRHLLSALPNLLHLDALGSSVEYPGSSALRALDHPLQTLRASFTPHIYDKPAEWEGLRGRVAVVSFASLQNLISLEWQNNPCWISIVLPPSVTHLSLMHRSHVHTRGHLEMYKTHDDVLNPAHLRPSWRFQKLVDAHPVRILCLERHTGHARAFVVCPTHGVCTPASLRAGADVSSPVSFARLQPDEVAHLSGLLQRYSIHTPPIDDEEAVHWPLFRGSGGEQMLRVLVKHGHWKPAFRHRMHFAPVIRWALDGGYASEEVLRMLKEAGLGLSTPNALGYNHLFMAFSAPYTMRKVSTRCVSLGEHVTLLYSKLESIWGTEETRRAALATCGRKDRSLLSFWLCPCFLLPHDRVHLVRFFLDRVVALPPECSAAVVERAHMWLLRTTPGLLSVCYEDSPTPIALRLPVCIPNHPLRNTLVHEHPAAYLRNARFLAPAVLQHINARGESVLHALARLKCRDFITPLVGTAALGRRVLLQRDICGRTFLHEHFRHITIANKYFLQLLDAMVDAVEESDLQELLLSRDCKGDSPLMSWLRPRSRRCLTDHCATGVLKYLEACPESAVQASGDGRTALDML